jgi:hypothetical protein
VITLSGLAPNSAAPRPFGASTSSAPAGAAVVVVDTAVDVLADDVGGTVDDGVSVVVGDIDVVVDADSDGKDSEPASSSPPQAASDSAAISTNEDDRRHVMESVCHAARVVPCHRMSVSASCPPSTSASTPSTTSTTVTEQLSRLRMTSRSSPVAAPMTALIATK